MKSIIFIFPFLCFSQNIKVNYTFTTTSYQKQETLIANSNSSYYYNEPYAGLNNAKDRVEGTEITLVQKKIKLSKIEFYQNKESQTILYQLKYKDERRLITDSVPDINWTIDKNKSKQINGYTCNMATTHFRGRDYEAWFTPEIPITFGPFKFKGLPGLILTLNSIGDNYKKSWIATKITTVDEKFPIPPICEDCTNMTLREFVEYKQNLRKEASKVSVSRLPKAYSNTTTTFTRNSIETIYEWEKEYDEEKK
ncbi:MAG: GLPGLI family protein [Nonlabens sp.]|uniref:GLPGLI family protein n=1 Tax=Nonlabens sp. TaxID=1888209 RepID=UPI00321C1EB5